MKSFKNFLPLVLCILFLTAATPVENTYTLSKDYAVTIQGTSNLHDWNETVESVTGKSIISWNNDGSYNLELVEMNMNVNSIKSDRGSIMNTKTYKALKAEANKEITFTLNGPVESIQIKSKTIPVKGKLSIAGVTKDIYMQLTPSIQDQKSLTFEGTQIIKMTDYGVTPPTALFGTLKTGNEVNIHFKINFLSNNLSIN